MLLAKVYFLQKDYVSALPYLEAIISSGVYQLEPDFNSVFDPANEGTNSEIIFSE